MPFGKKVRIKVIKAASTAPKRIKNIRVVPGKNLKKVIDQRIDKKDPSGVKNLHEPRTEYNNEPNVTADLRPVLPGIIQVGTALEPPLTGHQQDTVEARSGNRVVLKSLRVQGLVSIPPDEGFLEADRALLYCRLICFSCKRFQTHQSMVDDWLTGAVLKNKLLVDGQTAKPYEGTMSDMFLPINPQLFTKHYEKRFYLSRGTIETISAGSDGRGASHMPAVMKAFSFSLKVKNKKLLYVDKANTQPSNYGPALILIWSYANGASASSVAVPYMSFTSTARWKE